MINGPFIKTNFMRHSAKFIIPLLVLGVQNIQKEVQVLRTITLDPVIYLKWI